MKLHLLHGAGITSSRTKLINIKNRFDPQDVIVFEEGFDVNGALGSLATLPLFTASRLIVLENPPEELTLDPSFAASDLSLVLWLDREVSLKSPIFLSVKEIGGEVLLFEKDGEVSVFPFLDYLASKDNKAFLEIQKLKKGGFDIFYILTMVFYLLRNLVSTPKNAPEFVKRKLLKQRLNFAQEALLELYKDVLNIEFRLKMGLLDQTQAEFLLVNSFTL